MGNIRNGLIVIGVILIFGLGFVIGRLSSDNGRYSYSTIGKQLIIFDSKTGKFYIRDSNQPKENFFMLDVINADRKEYNEKVKKN